MGRALGDSSVAGGRADTDDYISSYSIMFSEEEYEDYRRLIEWETEQTIAAEKAATQVREKNNIIYCFKADMISICKVISRSLLSDYGGCRYKGSNGRLQV